MPKIILVDGHQIDIANVDVAEATIKTLQQQVADANSAKDKALADVATLTTEKATTDAKVVTLEKQLADSKITPKMLQDAAKSFADVVGKAKALGVTVADDADELGVKRAVVDAKLGDAAKGWNDEQIAASFLALTKDAKPVEDGKPDALASAIGSGIRPMTDAKAPIADARRSFLARKESAYLGQPA